MFIKYNTRRKKIKDINHLKIKNINKYNVINIYKMKSIIGKLR